MSKKSTIKLLNIACQSALKIPLDIEKDKFAILSDQHFGDGTQESDDFLVNKSIYISALNFYFKNNFTLIEVGDVEELWECDFEKIIRVYSDIYILEKKFFDSGRLYRIFGNHDIFWKNEKYLKKFLPEYTVYESIL